MKKIKLKNLKLEIDDMLQREQLKSILGGTNEYQIPGGDCNDTCGPLGSSCSSGGSSGTCIWVPCTNSYVRVCNTYNDPYA
ncbi:MAG: TIGR04149 family rSAM-modified RiPP [Bacteroidota bacterium]